MTGSKTSFFHSCLGVFQGGGCRAAAFAGAYAEAIAHGVHFSAVAGTSAGSIAAALIAAGAEPDYYRQVVEELDFQIFVGELAQSTGPRGLPTAAGFLTRLVPDRRIRSLLLHQGMYSSRRIEIWVEEKLQNLLPVPGRRVQFKDLIVPTWIVAADLVARRVKVWSQEETPEDEVAPAVRASCSIPLFFQPMNNRYVDGGALSNLPAFVFPPTRRPLARRVLAFALRSDDEAKDTRNTFDLIAATMSTLVDGAEDLQLRIQPDVHVISIPTGSVKATDFKRMEATTIKDLIRRGADATREFFENELARVHVPPSSDLVCEGTDEMNTRIVENLDQGINEIVIADDSAGWIYPLFPAFLYWRVKGVPIRAVLTASSQPPVSDEQYQRRLLRALGISVCEVPFIPTKAFIFNPNDPEAALAIVRIQRAGVEAVRYEGALHFNAIGAIANQIESLYKDTSPVELDKPVIQAGGHDELLAALRSVRQYSHGVDLTVETLPLSSLVALTSQVREFKYRQATVMAELYRERNLNVFQPAMVALAEGKTSIITPPVVEESGRQFILIQGSTRSVYCRDYDITKVTCVVARGVKEELPSEGLVPLSRVKMVGRTVSPNDRYGGKLNYSLFRDVERRVHGVSGLQ